MRDRTTPLMSLTTSRSFTRVRGLVCGNYGECPPDVHELLAITADGLAERRWRLMGARSMTEARAFFIARLRRSLSVVIAREMARHRLRRIPFIGIPRAAIRARQPLGAHQDGPGTCPRDGSAGGLHALPGLWGRPRRRARLNGRPGRSVRVRDLRGMAVAVAGL